MTDLSPICAVFDTNVIIAALKTRNPRSPTAELLRRWQTQEFEMMYSAELLAKYKRKFTDRQVNEQRANEFLQQLAESATLVEVSTIERVIEANFNDDVVVATAIASGATHLVTYDADFDTLGETYQGIVIIDGLHFLYRVRGDTPPE